MYFIVVNNMDAFNCDHVQYFKCNICFFNVFFLTLIEKQIKGGKSLFHTTSNLGYVL
jgi:hypothetical protein